MSLRIRLREELRQRRHHRAFRIAPPMWDDAQRSRLEQVITEFSAAANSAESAESAASAEPAQPYQVDEKALADAATNLWRAQRKLAGDGERPSGQARQAGRYLRACHEALAEAGLVVQDHDGDAFHPGRSLEVLVFEDDPSLNAETVLETVRPSIYFRDRRIQMGQVIVGSPGAPEAAPEEPDDHEGHTPADTTDSKDNHA